MAIAAVAILTAEAFMMVTIITMLIRGSTAARKSSGRIVQKLIRRRMTQLPAHKNSRDSYARAVVFVLTLVLTSPYLAVSMIPNIPWIALAFASILLLPYIFREFLIPRPSTEELVARMSLKGFPARVPSRLFIFSIFVPALYGAAVVPTLIALGKLSLILLVGLPMLAARARLAQSVFYGLLGAVWINFALLLYGVLTGGPMAGMMMLGRWGTMLNQPGALWRLAISVWFFAGYLTITRRSAATCLLLLVSTALIFLDGARTGIFLLLLECLLLVLVLAVERGRIRLVMFALPAGAIAYAMIVSLSGGLSEVAVWAKLGGLARVGELLTNVQALGIGGLAESDESRTRMFQDVVHAISNHPFFGSGMESTQSIGLAGPQNIHMTYLQVWANLGLLGMITYTWLTWGWLRWLPRVLRILREEEDDHARALHYNAAVTLLVFGIAACTYPLGSEWSDWIYFLVAYALLWDFVRAPKELFNRSQLSNRGIPPILIENVSQRELSQ